jgi:hypothetical protein
VIRELSERERERERLMVLENLRSRSRSEVFEQVDRLRAKRKNQPYVGVRIHSTTIK